MTIETKASERASGPVNVNSRLRPLVPTATAAPYASAGQSSTAITDAARLDTLRKRRAFRRIELSRKFVLEIVWTDDGRFSTGLRQTMKSLAHVAHLGYADDLSARSSCKLVNANGRRNLTRLRAS